MLSEEKEIIISRASSILGKPVKFISGPFVEIPGGFALKVAFGSKSKGATFLGLYADEDFPQKLYACFSSKPTQDQINQYKKTLKALPA